MQLFLALVSRIDRLVSRYHAKQSDNWVGIEVFGLTLGVSLVARWNTETRFGYIATAIVWFERE